MAPAGQRTGEVDEEAFRQEISLQLEARFAEGARPIGSPLGRRIDPEEHVSRRPWFTLMLGLALGVTASAAGIYAFPGIYAFQQMNPLPTPPHIEMAAAPEPNPSPMPAESPPPPIPPVAVDPAPVVQALPVATAPVMSNLPLPSPPGRGAVGQIILVTPDGQTRVVADGLRFPNGIAVSADHRRLVVAEMDGECLADYEIEPDGALTFRRRLGRFKDPDGICLDADEAVWVASFNEDAFILIDRDGHERRRVPVPGRRAVACALGGSDRKTLFCLSAVTSPDELRQRKSSARIDVVDVETPGSGYP
jgi:hypothetical protein